MSKKITKKQLKKHLNGLSKEELIDEILKLSSDFRDVNNYYSVKFCGKEALDDAIKESKIIIDREFNPSRGLPKARLNEAKKAIANIKSTKNYLAIAEIQLYYVSELADFVDSFAAEDDRNCTSIVSVFDDFAASVMKVEDFEACRKFLPIIESILDCTINIGYGVHEELTDIIYNYDLFTDELFEDE